MTLFKKILLLVPVVIVGALLSIIVTRPFAYEFSPLPKAVGTEDLSLIDPERRDPHSEQDIKRELSLRLWYPGIDEAEKEPAVWGYKKRSLIVGAIAAEKGLPTWLVDWVYPARVRSKEKLAVVPGNYPVILLLHGLGGETIENSTDLGETLAASGTQRHLDKTDHVTFYLGEEAREFLRLQQMPHVFKLIVARVWP